MATTKNKITTSPEAKSKGEVVFTKNTILHSSEFAKRRDLLSVLLKDGETYTMDQVRGLIDHFMKGKVK